MSKSLAEDFIYDISPKIDESLAVWPGDTRFSKEFLTRIEDGSNIDLGSIKTTLHLGAHVDAPSHYRLGSRTIDQVDLSAYVGEVQVIQVKLPLKARILPEHLQDEVICKRVFFRTDSYLKTEDFNVDFCSLSKELIDFLATKKVVLVGIDTPSVDPFDDKHLESHQALFKTEMLNIEGLVLKDIKPGVYDFIGLPLRLTGMDASPVRAILATRGSLLKTERFVK
jgi:arylformamidase